MSRSRTPTPQRRASDLKHGSEMEQQRMSDKTSSARSSGISFGDNDTDNTAVTGGVGGDYVSGDKRVYEAPSLTVSALHQLPSPPRDFTGREAEIAELPATLEDASLAISSLQRHARYRSRY